MGTSKGSPATVPAALAKPLSRRSFMGSLALAAAGIAAVGSAESAFIAAYGDEPVAASADPDGEGAWVPVQCWTSCGGKCLLQAHVHDGIVTRVKTDDVYPDTLETFQNRGCVRGRSMRKIHAGAERLKYPMKRKGWMPGGGANVNGELRGQDEWERISWDEAYDLVAREMRRIYDEYGGRSVLRMSFGRTCVGSKLFNPLGGYVPFEFCDSYGTNFIYTGNLGGYFNHSEPGGWSTNDRLDLLNADYISMEGGNIAWGSAGSPLHHLRRAKEAGAQFIYIGPEYNLTASALDARWIPVRPGTDTAFLLGVAYEMLRLDEERGDIIDWDFLDRCTLGFDEGHLPIDASTAENVRGYILGEYDGVPKTPEWASEICGAAPEDISWYAEVLGKNNAVTMFFGYAPSRCYGAENLPQMMETVACMGGHHGKPGHACGPVYHFFATNDGPDLVKIGSPEGTGEGGANVDMTASKVDDAILSNYVWQAINEGHYTWFGSVVDYASGRSVIQEPEERNIDIRMIWTDFGNPLTVRSNTNEGIEAFRKVDFVITLGLAFTPTAQYSDIVLPVATPWEDKGYEDVGQLYGQQNRETLLWQKTGICSPMYEAKTDREIVQTLAERLGLDTGALFPISAEQMHFNSIAGAQVIKEDGITWENLVSITQEDLDAEGVEGAPQEGRVPYQEMKAKGIYHVARTPGDNLGWIAYEDFRRDPEAHPRPSNSGKIELFCQDKADIFARLGWQDPDDPIKPYATYRHGLHGYEESFANWDAKEKGAYPIQVFNGHYLKRSHSAFDSCGWLREAYASPVFMSAQDAQARGIEDGDWVRLFNDAGEVVRQASVVETMMPGVVNLLHGSWPEPDKDLGISINGGTNYLTDSRHGDGPQQGYNTVLCQIERCGKQDILPDVMRPVVVPSGIEE